MGGFKTLKYCRELMIQVNVMNDTSVWAGLEKLRIENLSTYQRNVVQIKFVFAPGREKLERFDIRCKKKRLCFLLKASHIIPFIQQDKNIALYVKFGPF